jgi:hypothetical protein
MLIIVSTCFLLFNAPSHICTIGLKICTLTQTISINNHTGIPIQSYENFKQYNKSSPTSVYIPRQTTIQNEIIVDNNNLQWMELFYIIVIITQHIAYASYSINFFLYSFCGMKFRGELIRYMSNHRRTIAASHSTTQQNQM